MHEVRHVHGKVKTFSVNLKIKDEFELKVFNQPQHEMNIISTISNIKNIDMLSECPISSYHL